MVQPSKLPQSITMTANITLRCHADFSPEAAVEKIVDGSEGDTCLQLNCVGRGADTSISSNNICVCSGRQSADHNASPASDGYHFLILPQPPMRQPVSNVRIAAFSGRG
ncbi:hypothetical protein ANO11243_029580 [Dothideomycetidae sp. 11243]|nr:hypothetical protein ANO11243_029580 [fungal sp. No.11243]